MSKRSTPSAPSGRLAGRIALVTGASRGLGAAVGERFAAEGAHVILTARTVGGLEAVDDRIKAAGGSATLVPLDLKDVDKIDLLGASLYQRFGLLDIVVANAATLGDLGPIAYSAPKKWDHVVAVNLTANYRLIRAVDPLLRQSNAGRAVFVTDRVGRTPKANWGAYAVSKAGLDTLVSMYAAEVAKTAIRVNRIDPGPLDSGIRRAAYPGEPRFTHPQPSDVTDAFVRLADPASTDHDRLVVVQG